MARKGRVECAGAVYHLLDRGDRQEAIFRDDVDRECFVSTLDGCARKEVSAMKTCRDSQTGSYFPPHDDGNRGSVTYPGLAAFGYDYTARNQLKDMTFGGANVVGYTYDPNGNPLTRAPGTNQASSFAFDARNRITDITHNFDVGAKTYHYTYDAVGNRNTTRRDGGVTDILGYDNNSQMTSFSLGGVVTNLTYDASGNRTKVGTTGYSVNGLNQYTAVGVGSSLLYSTNGNLNSYNGWSYSFDAANRLTSAAQGATSANFYYDGLGRQIARTINGVASYSLWDGGNRVAEYGTGGTVLNRWIYAGGDLVRSGTSALRYFYADGLGSTSHLADASGNLLERYTYDLAGTPSIYAPGSTVPLSGSAYGVDMLFTGQKWYPALGLYDLRARPISPASAASSSPTRSASVATRATSIAIAATIRQMRAIRAGRPFISANSRLV